MSMDLQKTTDQIDKAPRPGSTDQPSPELIRDDAENDMDKQSDLDVPGGKGIIKPDIKPHDKELPESPTPDPARPM